VIFACIAGLFSVSATSSSVGESYIVSPTAAGAITTPLNYAQAVNDPIYGATWLEAMRDDVVGKYETNHAWELVDSIPRGRKVTKGKWVYRVVYKSDGTVNKFKARWVACGYS